MQASKEAHKRFKAVVQGPYLTLDAVTARLASGANATDATWLLCPLSSMALNAPERWEGGWGVRGGVEGGGLESGDKERGWGGGEGVKCIVLPTSQFTHTGVCKNTHVCVYPPPWATP